VHRPHYTELPAVRVIVRVGVATVSRAAAEPVNASHSKATGESDNERR
jgi:hypothetical protein